MNVRGIFAAGALTAAALVVPAAAASAVTCTPVAGPVGTASPADPGDTAATGLCVDGLGYLVAGAEGGEAYVVAGNDELGYVGLSNYETGDQARECTAPITTDGQNEGGTGTNSGGCYGTDSVVVDAGAAADAAPLLVCGDDTGDWDASTRDGCRNGNDDLDDLLVGILDLLP